MADRWTKWIPGFYSRWKVWIWLGISLAFGIFFLEIAEDVASRELPVKYDYLIENWLVGAVRPDLARIFMGGMSIGLCLWWTWKKLWRLSIGLMMSVAGAGLLNSWLKGVYERPRPDNPDAWAKAAGFSFPSGHAMISLVFFGFIAYALVHVVRDQKRSWVAAMVLGIIPLAVGISRLVLGVHYPTDVLAGWAAGASWLAACLALIIPFEFHNKELLSDGPKSSSDT
jgi:membrane-associated phospholipid phosphatase